jgi:hypothetical protein
VTGAISPVNCPGNHDLAIRLADAAVRSAEVAVPA